MDNCTLRAYLKLLRKSKVHKFDISCPIQKQVLGLKISVDDAATMEIIKGLHNTACVESGGGVIEIATISENGPELSAETGVHQHVEVFSVFECFIQLDDKVTVRLLHDFFFCKFKIFL